MRRHLGPIVARAGTVAMHASLVGVVTSAASGQARVAVGPSALGEVPAVRREDPTHREDGPKSPAKSDPKAGGTAILARTMVIHGAPRGFHVVTVPVPEQMADRATQYVVYGSGVAPILGRLTGTVAAGAGTRSVRFTIGVPTDVRAGTAPAGSVVFSATGSPDVEVPIALEIAPTRRVELTVTEGLHGVRPGERVALRYQLINLGNALDTIGVRLALPQGWRADGGDGVTALAPGASVTRTVNVTVPRDAGRGSIPIRLTAVAQGRSVATAEMVVELVGADGTAGASVTGTRLAVGAAGVRGPWANTPVGFTYALDGRLTDDIQVSARAATAPDPTSAAGMQLARVGMPNLPPSLALWAPSWRFAAGTVGATLTDLTGNSVGGQGASVSVTRGQWGATALASRPNDGPSGYGTNALYGQVTRQAGTARVTTSVSSLREADAPFGDPRRLDAVSAGLQLGSALDRMASTELAYRKWTGSAGLGASAAVALRGAHGTLDARASHSAGGSRAFARAVDELSLAGSRALTSWASLSASAWQLGDAGRAAEALRTDGWTLGANARTSANTSLNAGVQSSGYTNRTPLGRFGSADESIFGNLQARFGVFAATLDGVLGARTRSTAGAEVGESIVDRSRTSRYGSTLSVVGGAGTIAVSGAVTQNGGGVGYPAQQVEYEARIDQVPLVSFPMLRLVAGASATRLTSFVTPNAWTTTMRGTVGAELPLGMRVDFDAERNPLYFLGASPESAARWMYVMRIERSIGIPRFGHTSSTSGIVFTDTDGDGRLGKGEVGASGIVVRRGTETVVTGRDGRYCFEGASAQPVAIDVRSLPLGWIAQPRAGQTGGDIAVVSLAVVEVHLALSDADSGRVTRVDLEKAIVTARDSAGRTWVARTLAPGVARFDALPPGQYVTAVDFSQASEPLRIAEPAPTFTVSTTTVAPIRLQVRPRPLRFQTVRRPTPDSTRAAGDTATEPRPPKVSQQH